jgi:hypothetical protein
MEITEIATIIDSCQSLSVRELGEPHDNALRLVLQEGIVNSRSETVDFAGARISNVHRVEVTHKSRSFELVWTQYITYCVTNESYAVPEGSEIYSGRLFRTYTKSPFLDFMGRSTLATREYPGPYMHFCVVAEMHVVDIISTVAPTIRILNTR